MRRINTDALAKVKSYIKNNYDFESSLERKGLLDNSSRQGENIIIPCPFHDDFSPSFSANAEKQLYKCFACDRGGDLISFETNYSSIVDGKNTSYFDMANKLLQQDERMKSLVGYNSIFAEKEIDINNLELFHKPSLTYVQNSTPMTYLEVGKKIRKRENDIDTIKSAILNMQRGFSPDQLDTMIFGSSGSEHANPVVRLEHMDLEDILGGD